MLLKKLAARIIRRAENRIGVKLDYTHKIAETDMGLLMRYNRIFGFLDPNKHVPALAYHTARMRGAIAADCGICVEAEINLAGQAGLDEATIDAVLRSDYSELPEDVTAVANLTDAVVGRHEDDTEAREIIKTAYGDAGLIEVSFAMNGAALLPNIKRAMGYATVCDIAVLRRRAWLSAG
ncbi:carboxymuconolactone decarboxylase family protein [Ruegeria profundi]|uniref:hypothetical protein n=1 Tax=Ruegeria profundi TaxID=1685378 RepID=UPI001CD67C9E|nr:hypothetical protein [Ruegeria profundi]MCA0927809.1 hypothetical protein [Ruegeria profundi]